MKTRPAFTLIELIVGITLTGTVALLAYGTVQAGLDSAERLDRYRLSGESVALVRSLIGDALRHPSDPPAGEGASFEMMRYGESDALRFVSRGVSGPLGAGGLWRVEIRPSGHGIELSATSLDGGASPITGNVPALRSMSVRVRRAADDTGWQNYWESIRQFPTAVEISFRDSLGAIAGPQLIVTTGLEPR